MPDLPDVDSDGDGVPDLIEDANGNGLIDPGKRTRTILRPSCPFRNKHSDQQDKNR